jgi:RNA polymerase sigma factor (sigma-70 family)
MMMPNTISVVELDDSELVAGSIAGNREAFGQIVARYQSLICSLAYSATGSLSQSEDCAQETFITAWKHLAALREPAKLRSWLCGIARNLIHNSLRRQGRETSYAASSLEEISECPAVEPQPDEQAIRKEEEAILWHTLEQIPETYREPLVLYYREHKSVARVAESLELSEDAVQQRLTRGRRMLQEQVLALIEGTLERTAPGKAFTLEVVAALPLLAGTTKAVVATGLASLSRFASVCRSLLPIGLFVSLGGWLGYTMGGDAAATSPRRRASVARFWGILIGCLVVFVFAPMLLFAPLVMVLGRDHLLLGIRAWLDVMFGAMGMAVLLWVWQRRRQHLAETPEADGPRNAGKLIWLVVLGWVAAASLLALGASDSNWKVDRISAAKAREVIRENYQHAQIWIFRSQDGTDDLWIRARENGQLFKWIAPADKPTLSLLAEKGIKYPIYVQGRDYEVFGWQGKALLTLCLFVLIVGTVALLTLLLKNKSKEPLITKNSKIALAAVVILIALIVTPLVLLNHRKVDYFRPNPISRQSLNTDQSALAQQTARDLFEALGNGDWDKVATLCPPGFALGNKLNEQIKGELAGLQVISLGDPFVKPPYPGVFVPYEIRFKSGETKKYQLAIRQDNPERKWYFDGGL